MVKLLAEVEGGRLKGIKITGDFFIHPEESLELLEKELVGRSTEVEELYVTIAAFFQANEVEAFGLDARSLAKALSKACRGRE